MKKTLLFIFKTGLFIFFISNLGIIRYLANTEKHPPAPYRETFREEINWLNEKYENAQRLGAQYSPELCFADIGEIQLKQNNNDFDRRSLLAVTSTQSALAAIFHQNFNDLRFKSEASQEEITNYMKRIEAASCKYEELLSPGITKRKQETILKTKTWKYWTELFVKFFMWILHQYLKNLPLALLLLWTWWYQERKTLKINNPLSFILCLLIYPIVIIRTWKEKLNNQARYLVITTSYRQQQRHLFSLFSENEIAELKRLARTNISLSAYRKSLSLKHEGTKHSFFPALIVSLIFIVLPESTTFAQSISSYMTDTSKTEQLENAPPTNLVASTCDFVLEKIELSYKLSLSYFLSQVIRFYHKTEKCLKGFLKELEHVPKLVTNIY